MSTFPPRPPSAPSSAALPSASASSPSPTPSSASASAALPSPSSTEDPPEEREVSKLDNLTTYSYTYAVEQGIPVRLVMIIPRDHLDFTDDNGKVIEYRHQSYYFLGLLDLMSHYQAFPLEDLIQLMRTLLEYNPRLRFTDLIFSYLYNALDPYDLSNPALLTPLQEEALSNILTLTNDLRVAGNESRWDSLGAAVSELENWEQSLEEEYLRDDYANQMLINAREVLVPLIPVQPRKFPRSDLVYHHHDLVFHPLLTPGPLIQPSSPYEQPGSENRRPVLWYDGPDIFDRVMISLRVPFARYNDHQGNARYKVYSGRDGIVDSYGEQTPLDYQKLLPNQNDIADPDHLYLLLYLGDDSDSINEVPRDLVQLVTYHLRSNTLRVRIPVRDRLQEDAILRLGLALSGLTLGPVTRTNISGEFLLWNLEFDEWSLLYAILNYDAFRLRFYAEERGRAMATRKRVELKYHHLALGTVTTKDIDVTLYHNVTVDASDQFFPEHNQTITVPPRTPYVRVVIGAGSTYEEVNDFSDLFPLFMTYYHEVRPDITSTLRQFLPKIMDNIELLTVTAEGESLHRKDSSEEPQLSFVKRNSESLQKYAPDLFVANYKRRCKAEWLPSIIFPDQLGSWIARHPDHYYLPYPPTANPRFYLVCMQEGRPYLNVKYNLQLINKETHPYIFCCHPRNRLNDPEARARIEQYLNQAPVPLTINTKASNIIVTQRVLPPGGLAILPYTLTEFFRSYQPHREELQFLRYGINFSPNSFIHAVLTALQYPEYITLTDQKREEYVTDIRTQLSATFPGGLVKQECYDESEEEIHHYLDQATLPLDPLKYYRLLEERYGINIYLCGLSEVGLKRTGQEHKSNTGQKVLHNALLQLPRYYQYHYQTRRCRPTVIIYRNFGSEADGIDYVQCELITVYHRDNNNLQLTFSSSFGEYCYDALLSYHRLLSWLPGDDDSVFPYHQYRLWSAHHNWETFLSAKGLTITGQYLDDYGKLRGLVITDHTHVGTLLVLPDQPLNVVTVPLEDLPVSDDALRSVLGEPGPDGYYPLLGIPQGYYLVTASHPNFLVNSSLSPTVRLTSLRRTIIMIQQTMLWLYHLLSSQYGRNDLDTVNYFFHEYVTIDDYEGDTYQYYQFLSLPRVFPSLFTTYSEGAQYLAAHTERVIVEGKFNCYSRLFAHQCYQYLRGYVATHPILPPFLYYHQYYYSSHDYRHHRHVQLFLSSDELEAWLDRQLLYDDRYYNLSRVHKTISLYRSYLTYPYYFEDTVANHYYLIQNVSRGSLGGAIAVASLWLREGINGGFSLPSELALSGIGELPPDLNYIIYTITPIGTIIATIVTVTSSTVPLEILCYGDAYSLLRQQPHLVYAAMLPLRS